MSRIGLAPALCLAVLLSDTPVFAQMLPDADPVPLWDQLERAYQRGDFQRVVALSRKAIVDMPTMPAPRYELACGLAMLGNKNAALEASPKRWPWASTTRRSCARRNISSRSTTNRSSGPS